MHRCLFAVAVVAATVHPARAEHTWLTGAIVEPSRKCARDEGCLARQFADVLTAGTTEKECASYRLRVETLVSFSPGSARVRASDRRMLSMLARQLLEHAARVVVVEGFAYAPTRDEAINRELSMRRAERVREYLAGYGVEEARILAVARGSKGAGRRVGLVVDGCPSDDGEVDEPALDHHAVEADAHLVADVEPALP